MNCHGNHNENNGEGHKHGFMKHSFMMILCCAAPIIVLLVLSLLKVTNSTSRGILTTLSSLICPIMMIGMIPMMLGSKKDKQKNCHQQNTQIETRIENENK